MSTQQQIDVRLYARLINLAALTILSIVCVATYLAVSWYYGERVAQLNQQTTELRSSLKHSARINVELNQLIQRKRQLDAGQVEPASAATIAGSAQLNGFLARHFQETNLAVTSIAAGHSSLPLTGESLNIKAEGSFENVCRFLNRIERSMENVRLEELSIQSIQEQERRQVLMRFGLERVDNNPQLETL
jgi:Tfp pilus assembly protein PilO